MSIFHEVYICTISLDWYDIESKWQYVYQNEWTLGNNVKMAIAFGKKTMSDKNKLILFSESALQNYLKPPNAKCTPEHLITLADQCYESAKDW